MSGLAGRTALVTGGTSGIGRAAVEMLRERGARVVFCGRDRDRGQAVAGDDPDRRFVVADIGDEDGVQRFLGAAMESFGPPDIVLNNAGDEGATTVLGDYPVDVFDRVIRTNVRGPFLLLRQALPHLLARDGIVVNVASFVGTVVPVPIAGPYGASKAALLSLTASTAAAYAESGLRVFSVVPWITDTPMVTERVSGGSPEAVEQLVALNPSGTMVSAGDVAAVICDIFESPGRHANGSAIMVDAGGATAVMAFPITGSGGAPRLPPAEHGLPGRTPSRSS